MLNLHLYSIYNTLGGGVTRAGNISAALEEQGLNIIREGAWVLRDEARLGYLWRRRGWDSS